MEIVIRSGPNVGRAVALRAPRITVGRAIESDIALYGDWRVSRRHCEILRTGSTWSLIDIGSKNGTLVNGRPIDRPTLLRDGDVVRVGGCELLVRALPKGEPSPSPAGGRPFQRAGHLPLSWLVWGIIICGAGLTLAGLIACWAGWL